jgi:hypothetical protein
MMKLSSIDMETNSKIDVLNLLSNDATRLEDILYLSSYLITSPIQALVIIYILIVEVDYTILSGLAVIALILIFQLFLSKIYSYYK